jgi:putative ABC transport system permease protein
LLFVIVVSLVSSVLSGLAPALKASRTDINMCLKSENRTSSASRSQNRLQTVLVISEIALALFLLIGTGLLIRGLFLIEHQYLGFRTDHLLTAAVKLDEEQYKDDSQRKNFVHKMISSLSQLPGVETVAASSRLPATSPDVIPVEIEGQIDSADNQIALDVVVTTDYFRAVGIPLLHGRTFTETDKAGAPQVVVVNKEFVERYFKNKEPLGKQIQLNPKAATPGWAEIVGVVDNVKSYSEVTRDDPQVYEPLLQRPLSTFSLILLTTSEPNGLISTLYQAFAQLDTELPLARVMSMDAVIETQRYGNRFFTRVLVSFALLALVLASIGIYGLIAYSVAQRIQEIGIRLVLGATRAHILRMVLIKGIKMTAIGSTMGLLMAFPLPKLFGFIFDGLLVKEPRLYIFVAAIMLIVTILATYIPARRASLVDPSAALRNQ